MATQSLPQNPRHELEGLLQSWESRWRFKTVLLYLPRILLLAFGLGILAILIVTLLRLLSANSLIMLVAVLVSATIVGMSSFFAFFGAGGIEAARKFDKLFGLQERLSTAFELIDGRIKSSEELAALQLRDTLQSAQAVDAKQMIRLEWRKLEWFGAVLLGIVLAIFLALIFFNGLRAAGLSADTEAAIDAAAATTQGITELVATDSTLSAEDRQNLLDSAETTLSELQNPETSAEDAFAAMSELEADLSAQAQEMQQNAAESASALSNASSALAPENETPDPNQIDEQLNDLANRLNNMSAAEQAALAERMQAAADALRESNPEMAENLDAAANALQSGDTAAAQDALASAAQNAQADAETNAAANAAAQDLAEAAAQAQQASQDIAASEYNENAQSEGEVDPNSTIEEQLGMQEPDIQAMPGEDGGGGEGQNGEEPTSGTQGDLVESDDPNARPADTQGQADTESQSQEGAGQGDESNSGAGAGDGDAPQTNEIQGGAQQNQVGGENNNPTGEGETDYEEVYAPIQDSATVGQEDVVLETNDGEQPAVEGNFQENPNGESSIPYNQVFGSYADAANRALDSGYVPLGVRDVVRDYFTSIEPTGNTQP